MEKITTILKLVQVLPKAQILEGCINNIGKGRHQHFGSCLLTKAVTDIALNLVVLTCERS